MLTDLNLMVNLFTFYLLLTSGVFFLNYRHMHRTDLFIVNGAALEYTKKNLISMVNDAVLEYIY